MKHRINLCLIGLAISLLYGCTDCTKVCLPPYNELASSVLILENDTMPVYVADFFPTMEQVDSITSSSLTIMSGVKPTEQFVVICQETTPALSTINFWNKGDKVSIIARRTNDLSKEEKINIFTTADHETSFEVAFTKQPDQLLIFWQNMELPLSSYTWENGKITIKVPAYAATLDRSFIRVIAAVSGTISNDLLIPLQSDKVLNNIKDIKRTDKEAQVLYSLMIDRFNNGDKSNDRPLNLPDVLPTVDFQGGDFQGIIDKIKSGFFRELGVNTIWMTPIAQNPETPWGYDEVVKTRFSAYHGYWPIHPTALNEHFGTEDKLHELLDIAHQNDMNVIVDYVANHLHKDSPILKEHPDWATPMTTADGRLNVRLFDEYRLTTWFDTFLPTLDMEKEAVREAMTDSAVYWLQKYDFDGFRHDAAKHIHESYWRLLTKKIRKNPQWNHIYQIGETYGSPSLIRSYVKAGQLDGQFDFNIYHSAVNTFGFAEGDMHNLNDNLLRSLDNYGYHNLMGYISGNHDKPRFISVAGGTVSLKENTKLAGRIRNITVGDSAAYDKLAVLEAFMLTIPGVPCIYQGDEYGVPGASDPDNRRMMQFDGYCECEQALLNKVKQLVNLRRSSLPLIYGDVIPLYCDKDVIAFARVYMGKTAVVACNRSNDPKNIEVSLPAALRANHLKNNFHCDFEVSKNTAKVTLPPYGFEVLLD